LEKGYLDKFLGTNNLVSLEGAHWKTLRSMFNPGFSAANIMTLADSIIDASLTFCDVLRGKAETNELFELEDVATRLTIEIIGKAVLDVEIPAQRTTHPIVKYFRERVVMMPPADAVFPWQAVDLLRPLKLWWNGRQLDNAISVELDLKIQRRAKEFQEGSDDSAQGVKKRTVLDLALNAYEQEMSSSSHGSKASEKLTRLTDAFQLPPGLKADIVDSLKTFIFAGHDTTSSTICWAFYLLHRHPDARKKLDAELNTFFPKGTSAAEKIKQDPYIVNRLEYTTAVLRETMRLFPPASTLRAPDAFTVHNVIIDPKTKTRYPMAGTHVWPIVHLINRNKRFFPEPTKFIPERFIQSQTPFPEAELFTVVGKDAFRPFEKGPRNCIGQELAMLEGKIILALTSREFDFTLEYPGEDPDPQYPIPESTAEELSEQTEYGRGVRAGTIKPNRIEGHRVFQILAGSAKPTGNCPGRVKIREL
jgi:cytochrome P450